MLDDRGPVTAAQWQFASMRMCAIANVFRLRGTNSQINELRTINHGLWTKMTEARRQFANVSICECAKACLMTGDGGLR